MQDIIKKLKSLDKDIVTMGEQVEANNLIGDLFVYFGAKEVSIEIEEVEGDE